MVVAREWQDAGQQRPLSVGQVYDLPEGVAVALIATGAAARATSPTVTSLETKGRVRRAR